MKKFCKYCGTELAKGASCDCQKEIKISPKEMIKPSSKKKEEELKKTTETIKTEVTNTTKQYALNLVEVSRNIIAKPKDTIKKFIEQEDFSMTMIVLICTSLIVGFCTVSFMKGIYSSIGNYMGSGFEQTIPSLFDVSYFKMFLCVSSGMFLGYLILGLIFYLGFEKIGHSSISFKKTMSIIAISVLEPALYCILAAFFTAFSYKLAIIILAYAILLYFVNLYQAFSMNADKNSNHFNQLFVILMVVFGFLAIYLIPNLFL